MALTRNFKQTVVERAQRDQELAKALLDEATILFLSNEPETARIACKIGITAARLSMPSHRRGE